MNNILRSVLMRRSTSQLDARPIQDDELMEILEEGKMLSNAPHNQKWHFTVLQNRSLMERLSSAYARMIASMHGNIWGEPEKMSRVLVEGPMLLLISGDRDVKYAVDAANMVFGSMMLVAEKYGIRACWLTSASELFLMPEAQAVVAQLGIPEGYEPLCIGVFGYKRPTAPPQVLTSADNVVNFVK